MSYKESDTRLSTPTHWAIWVVPNFQHLTLGKFKVKVKVAQSYLTLCDPMDCIDSPGQDTGVGSFSLLQGIFPTQGLNPGLQHYRQILSQLSHKGSP